MTINQRPFNLKFDKDAEEVIRGTMPSGWSPNISIILGSGLGDLAKEIEDPMRIEFRHLWPWATSSLPGHDKQVVLGSLCGLRIMAFSGRIHGYEGYTPEETVQPVLLAKAMGSGLLVLTNAAGGLNPDLFPGKPMIITDQLDLTKDSPLRGRNNDPLLCRFPSPAGMYKPQVERLRRAMQAVYGFMKLGVYAGVSGPAYETGAEVRMYRNFGGDAIGMSTVQEALVATATELPIAGISLITNIAGGTEHQKVTHEEVTAAGKEAGPNMVRFMRTFFDLYRTEVVEATTK